VFGIILFSIVALFHLYVFWRAGTVPLIKKHLPVRIIGVVGVLLWSVVFLARFYGHAGTGQFAAVLEFACMTWMAMLFLFAVTLLLIDIITCFGLLMVRMVPSLRGLALIVGLLLALIAMVQGLRAPVVSNYEVTLSGLPVDLDGIVLVAISDLHLGTQIGPDWLSARVEQVMAEKPDIILLLGDIYEGHSSRPDQQILAAMRRLSAPLGVWGILGNHEFYGGPEVIRALSEDSGLTVLRNSWQEISPGLVLAGLEGRRTDRRPDDGSELVERTLAGLPEGGTILMSHKPWQVEMAAGFGVELMLSGHTHGGQIWPFGYLVKLFFPQLAGRYQIGGMTLLVGRGTGTWGPRMRLWTRGEILRIHLRSASKE
jgi:predicted MPP superfamily phosphohydrolase